jgi:hypothetical protein
VALSSRFYTDSPDGMLRLARGISLLREAAAGAEAAGDKVVAVPASFRLAHNLGILSAITQDDAASTLLFEESLRILDILAKSDPTDYEYPLAKATAMTARGERMRRSNPDAAAELAQQAKEILTGWLHITDRTLTVRRHLAKAALMLATREINRGQPEAAFRYGDEALALADAAYSENTESTLARADVIDILIDVATLRVDAARRAGGAPEDPAAWLRDSQELLKQARAADERLFPPGLSTPREAERRERLAIVERESDGLAADLAGSSNRTTAPTIPVVDPRP